ncbi:MAG: 3-hydroxyacyl-CoA dehydrogenase [Smithellaceae bacterium]|nr:3-hydroxyacyl-CoA dehydrogenase [Smithellaceae bacterium]
MQIRDSVGIVTGGASGLGEECVRSLVRQGARAAILDLAAPRGEALARELGDRAIFIKTDVTSEESAKEAIAKARECFGALNLAINCAGVGDPAKVLSKKGPISLDFFRRVVEINLIGTLNVIRLALEVMVSNEPSADGERGVIINTASIAAFDGQIGQAAYSASKAGVVGMTLPIARECAEYGVRVVTIAPGLFETPMMAQLPEAVRIGLAQTVPFPKRLGRPDEFARLALHIIENNMINGECIRLDGALRMAAR